MARAASIFSRKRSRTHRKRSVSYDSDISMEFESHRSSERRSKRRRLETSNSESSSSSSSSSDTDPDTLTTPRERILRSGTKVSRVSPPCLPSTCGKSAEQSQVKKFTPKPGPRHLSAIQARKIAQEADREAKARRELMIGSLTNQIASELIKLGDCARDISHVCSEKFGWEFREWQHILKEGKVLILAPNVGGATHSNTCTQNKSNRKRLSLGRRAWSAELEVNGLSLCIMKSGGMQVLFSGALEPEPVSLARTSINWETISDYGKLRCVFVHQDSIEDFLSHGQPSVLDLTHSKPRIQLFVFGKTEPSNSATMLKEPDVKIELIFKAGAVIIPTFESLFEKPNPSDNNQQEYFTHLQAACQVHPFLRVCLHPRIYSHVISRFITNKTGSAEQIGSLMEFLNKIGDSTITQNQNESWSEWVKLPRAKIGWMPQEAVESEDEEYEVLEFKLIVKILKKIRLDLFKDFRRFIIAIPDKDNDLVDLFSDGIECMKISQLCKILKNDPF